MTPIDLPEMWTLESIVQAVRDGHTFLISFAYSKDFGPNGYIIAGDQYHCSGVTVGPEHTPDIAVTPEGSLIMTLYFPPRMVPNSAFYGPIRNGVGPVHALVLADSIDWEGLNRGQQYRVPKGSLPGFRRYRRNSGMSLGISLSQHHEMDPIGGASDSIFKKSERFLLSSTKVQEALERLSDDDDTNPEDYQSLMDYIVCAIFPEIKPACFAYYDGEGPQMRGLISPSQIEQLDRLILAILKIVTLLEESNSSASWGDIRQQIIKHFAAKRITAPTKNDWAAAGEMIQKYVLTRT